MRRYNSGYELGKQFQMTVWVATNNVGCHQVTLPATYSPDCKDVESGRKYKSEDESRTIASTPEDKRKNGEEDG